MKLTNYKIPLFFASIKFLLHLVTNTHYGFHRDELLYLALGRHLDWGYWSNPPLIGFLSFLNQNILGDSLFATRLIPAFFGSAILFFICLMAKELGGKNYAQILAGIVGLVSIAFLRSSHMFQPVVMDIFFWTITAWLLIRYLKEENVKWLLPLGVAVGLGFLNKYSIAFLLAALAIAFLLTPKRIIFIKKQTWIAIAVAFLIVLPNLLWQWKYNFPVAFHMQNLAETQLSAVNPAIFLLDQLLMHFIGFLVWIPGLYFLLFDKNMNRFKVVGFTFLATVFLFLVMSGKNYYTLGAFPMVIAAGGVFWEQKIKIKWKRWGLAFFIFIFTLPMLPASLPILSANDSIKYFDYMVNSWGIKSLTRWERGNIEALPQDYADMFGWEEFGTLVDQAIEQSGHPENCFIYGEDYPHAGAVERFAKHPQLPAVASFSDTYRMWAPDKISPNINTLIYINDEMGEDVQALFSDIKLIGQIENPNAREKGTSVYLCQNPNSSFATFWESRIKMVKSYYMEN